jgi:hypothetical protein
MGIGPASAVWKPLAGLSERAVVWATFHLRGQKNGLLG